MTNTATATQLRDLKVLVDGRILDSHAVAEVERARDAFRGKALTVSQASAVLGLLRCQPLRRAEAAGASRPARVEVPEGYYALERDVTKFYRVSKGTGRWDGRTFVNAIGGPEEYRMGYAAQMETLRLIGADLPAARALYGSKIRKCSRCNRRLTDKMSRKRGVGPECWEKI